MALIYVLLASLVGVLLILIADLTSLTWSQNLTDGWRTSLRDIGVALLTGSVLGFVFLQVEIRRSSDDDRRANIALAHSIGFGEPVAPVANGRPNPILRGLDLEGANLSGLMLEGLDLTGTNLKDAKLRGTHLNGSRLEETDLRGADLTSARLEGALLFKVHLDDETSMSGVSFDDATLNDVDFSQVIQISDSGAGGNSWLDITCVGTVTFPEPWRDPFC